MSVIRRASSPTGPIAEAIVARHKALSTLTPAKEWQRYEIDVNGQDQTRLKTRFVSGPSPAPPNPSRSTSTTSAGSSQHPAPSTTEWQNHRLRVVTYHPVLPRVHRWKSPRE
jgi:hypothetical protein